MHEAAQCVVDERLVVSASCIINLLAKPVENVVIQPDRGGVSLPSQLGELGLVDDCFVVGPTVAGEGRRLLEAVSLPERLQLKLVESLLETVTEKICETCCWPSPQRTRFNHPQRFADGFLCLPSTSPQLFDRA